MSFQLLISLLGTLQGVILSFFFFKNKHRVATLLLGLYVFVFSIGLLEEWIIQHSHSTPLKLLQALISNSSLLYGPLLYLFVHYLATGNNKFNKYHWTHFSLFAIAFTTQCWFIFMNKQTDKDSIIDLIAFELFVIQILTYNILAIRTLKKHYTSILNTWSSIEEMDLSWLRALLISITSIYAFSFLLTHLIAFGADGISSLYIIVQVAITFTIYLMSYLVLFRARLFTPEMNVKTERYKKSGLKQDQAKKHLADLQLLMDTKKPYKNPEFNIYSLADLLGISRNHLTQVLNEELKMNFFEFVNHYRVQEAKRLLTDPSFAHLNLPGIATESGYKSKSTFFTNFRKITGQTPQEWAKNQTNPDIPVTPVVHLSK